MNNDRSVQDWERGVLTGLITGLVTGVNVTIFFIWALRLYMGS